MIKIIILLNLFFIYNLVHSQSVLNFESNYNLFLSSPGSYRFGLNGFDNPALLTYQKALDVYFLWNTKNKSFSKINDFGLFAGAKNFGFGYYKKKVGVNPDEIKLYRLSSSFGNKSLSVGFAYTWNKSIIPNQESKDFITLSAVVRPSKYLSIGLINTSEITLRNFENVLDLAIRPFGNEFLTIFTDYQHQKLRTNNYTNWSAGAVFEPLAGVQLAIRYFESKNVNLGLQVSLGNAGFIQVSKFNKDFKTYDQVYGIRLGGYDRNIISKLVKSEKSHEIDLNVQIKYQKYQLFDNSKTLLELLKKLENIKTDKSIKRIEINLSDINTSRIFLWELREKLRELKSFNKEIYVYIDNANIDIYHFASVADKIIMDPIGLLIFEGYLLGRNFYKGTLDKLGIGVDEWRFFKYKSAAESFSRENMSDADKEQRDLIIENLYNSVTADIQNSRPQIKVSLDTLINKYVLLTAQEALEFNLVDTLARWYEINSNESGIRGFVKYTRDNSIEKEKLPEDNYWSEKPRIAVVYLLGPCAMDEGIKARKLIKDLEKIEKDNSIKAVVFRVDSPGGDALASDVIAEGMKKIKKRKPVIVSQGLVAGSGGYWLSMNGDTIVSMPNTITGSIGVIGFWFYNKGFKESLGISTDYVKRGESADLGFGMFIPLIGLVIPDRMLSTNERNRIENMILTMYDDFVEKVASGRNKTKDEIEKVAQGRVWSGSDAINLGLVDVLGGLEKAINIAAEKSGLKKDEFEIVEFPKPDLIDLSSILPFPIISTKDSFNALSMLRFRIKQNGKPLTIIPLDFIDEHEYSKVWNF